MDILRRNTDYSLQAMVHLTQCYGVKMVSAKDIAIEQDISYQLTCKLLQKLHKAKLVESVMGPKGGFKLSKKPGQISLLDIIEVIQGPVRLNRCLLGANMCPKQVNCVISSKLTVLQEHIVSYLSDIALNDLLPSRGTNKGKRKNLKRKTK
ncbi:MAG: Rrf2 family transcriptional regulator [Planctomycetes bacterium]|nr:Rrf2 family transcriptional regulator [Planctomycetota bacterium]